MSAALLDTPRTARRRWALELLGVALLGALQALSFAPHPLWWLQIACTAGFAWRVQAARRPARAALLGLVFGTAWLCASVWWLFISMHFYGGLAAWMAALAVLALCAFLSLYLATAMAAFAKWRFGSPLPDAVFFGAMWLAAELARGVLFTGFPWAASGYAHVDGPLAALAPWVGVYGIGAVAAMVAALVAALAARRSRASRIACAVAGGVLLLAPQALPQDLTQPSGTLSVTLLQGNVAQEEKFASAYQPQALAWYANALAESPGDLVVAPETAVPLLPEQLPDGFWDALSERFAHGDRAGLLGLPLGSFEMGYTNSVAGLSAASIATGRGYYRYDKHHLVPFGEFIPPGFHWFTEMMSIPLGDFARGPLNAPSFQVRGERIGPNICYEDLFGEELAARFVEPSRAPTIFANVSNIAWFGDSVAISQHLQISRMRSLELQRPMIRATNTGATALIDHRGQVTQSLAPITRGILQGQVQGRTGRTPFAVWASDLGLWPLWVLVLAALVAAIRESHRRSWVRPEAPPDAI